VASWATSRPCPRTGSSSGNASSLPTGGRNKARRLDTTITKALFRLRNVKGIEERPKDAANLAVRNLLRGYVLRMPIGQGVAKAMKLQPLTSAQLLKVANDSGNSDQAQALKDGNFHRRTPLWYYLLAEAKHHGGGNRLGPVGSRIVAEVLVGLVRRSQDSISLAGARLETDHPPGQPTRLRAGRPAPLRPGGVGTADTRNTQRHPSISSAS
jgi:hypothetical protein